MGDWLSMDATFDAVTEPLRERNAELRQVCSRQVEIIQRYRAYLGRIGFAVGDLPGGTEPTPVEAAVARLVKAALEGGE